jgi:hypothetical protein
MSFLRKNVKTTTGLTASTTQTQAGALQLENGVNRITTVGSAADAVKLPKANPGAMIIVTNAAAANAMGVFPAPGDSINALAANAVYSMAANKTALFIAGANGVWHTILTA